MSHSQRRLYTSALSLLLIGLAGCAAPTTPPVRSGGVPAMPPASATLGTLPKGQNGQLSTQSVTTTAFCDDFTSFDTARWNTYSTPGAWGFYNTSGTYEAANTTVQNGHLVMKLEHVSGDVRSTTSPAVYRSAVVESVERMGYGTYDSWVRLSNTSDAPAVNGTTPGGTFSDVHNYVQVDYADAYTDPDTLIESKYGYGTPNDLIYSIYKTNQPAMTTPVSTAQNLSQGFHHQRWEWSASALRFFIDGVLVHELTDPARIPSEAAHLYFNMWPTNKADWNMPGTSATRYTLVDKFCFTPPDSGSGGTGSEDPLPVQAAIDTSLTPPTVSVGSEAFFSGAGSTGEDLRYTWTFGDGTTVEGDPETSGAVGHTYTTPGYYTAQLRVLDVVTGQTNTVSLPIAVLPEIHDMLEKRAVTFGELVKFNVQFPVAGLTYLWTLPDGSVHRGSQFETTFTTPGVQDVSLKIYDERLRVQGQVVQRPKQQDEADTEPGLISEEQTRVNVLLPKFPTVRIESSGEVMGYRDPLEMTFEATASSNASPDLLSSLEYTWKFDDGAPISGKVVQHTYTRPGVNVVELTTKDKYGRSNSTHLIVAPWTCGEGEAICQQLDNTQYNPFLQPTRGNKLVHYGIATNSPPPKTPGEFTEMRGYINSVSSDLNGLTKSLPGVTPPLEPCRSFIPMFEFNSNVYSQLKSGQNVHNYQANATWTECFLLTSPKPEPNAIQGSVSSQPKPSPTAMPYTPPTAGSRNFLFSAFAGLRVPRIGINILPDTQLPSDEPNRFTYVEDGVTKFLMVFNVRESDITSDGRVNLDIPVYAVDEQGRWLNDLDGIFDASFVDSRIASSSIDRTMINGQSEIAISVPIAQFADNLSQLDLTQLILTGSDMGCDHASGITSAADPESGCLILTTTDEMPKESNPLAPQSLKAQAYSPLSLFLPFPVTTISPQSIKLGIWGATPAGRKAIDKALKYYDGSTASILVGLFPIVGDTADLLVSAYNSASGKGVDPVVTTLAGIGLVLDLTSAGTADITAPLKAVYKFSRNSKGFLSESVKSTVEAIIRGKIKPTSAYSLISNQFGAISKVFIRERLDGIKALDKLAANLKLLPSCSLFRTQNLQSLSCGDYQLVIDALKSISFNGSIGGVSVGSISNAIDAICCGEKYIDGAENIIKGFSDIDSTWKVDDIVSELNGLIAQALNLSRLKNVGFSIKIHPEKFFSVTDSVGVKIKNSPDGVAIKDGRVWAIESKSNKNTSYEQLVGYRKIVESKEFTDLYGSVKNGDSKNVRIGVISRTRIASKSITALKSNLEVENFPYTVVWFNPDGTVREVFEAK